MIIVAALVFVSTQIIQSNTSVAQLNTTGPPLIHEDDLASQNGSSVYEDKDVGFSLNYPSDWTIGDEDAGRNTVASFISPNSDVYVNIRVFPHSLFKSLKDFGNSFKKGDDYTLLAYYRNSTTLLDGKPAFKAIYLTTYNPSIFEDAFGYQSSTEKAMFIATLVPEKKSYFAFAYFAEPSNFENYLPVVEEMSKTFQIGGKGPVIQEED
jgi:PsbP